MPPDAPSRRAARRSASAWGFDLSGAPSHERTSEFLLARFERRVLPRLAAALPARVMPDHMTALGLLASTGIAAAYVASNRSAAWLWAASALLVVQWFGDSLDGTLARVRKIERPRYGYYLDHLTDAYSTLAIGLGLGLSPYMLLAVGLAIAVAYLVLSINVYLETYVFGQFSFSYGRLGPTEVRLVLILLNTVAIGVGPVPFTLAGYGVTAFDVAGAAASAGMLALLSGRVVRNLRTLAAMEPPAKPVGGAAAARSGRGARATAAGERVQESAVEDGGGEAPPREGGSPPVHS